MKKEMTKKEMKEYLKGEINSKWEHIRTIRHLIDGIEQQQEQSDNDIKLLEMLKDDKNREVSKADDLEKLLMTFFGENQYGEKVGA